MFSIRGQLHILLTMIAGLMIAAIPVTVTFAQSYDYNANYSYNGSYSMPYGNSGYQQQYLYWCTGQGGGYYSYNPCPTYQQPMQPAYQVPAHHYNTYTRYSYYPSYQYYYPQQSYYYPSMYYGYNYGSYNYNYNYNYGGNWGYAW
jgi:hypothetical protein